MTLGNYTSASGVTIGHGLGKAPSLYFHKSRASSGAWHVYHSSLGATKALVLNTTATPATAIGYFANTEPTADVLSLGNTFAGTGDGMVYAWAEIEGFSKFGTYEGNANNGNGPFIYTGFRPRLLFIKDIDAGNEWYVQDTARETHNPTEKFLPIVNKVLEISKQKEKNTPGYYVGNYYYVMWRTLLESSIRIGELLPLKINDYDPIHHALDINKNVDLQTGIVYDVPKTETSDGIVFMSHEYTELYVEWIKELKTWNNPKGLLFPSRVGTIKSYRRVDLQFKNFFKKAGFEERITLHDFRSFGSKIREFMGLDETAQEHLRHATPQMTKYYQRGKNWKDAEKQIAASTQIAGLLK